MRARTATINYADPWRTPPLARQRPHQVHREAVPQPPPAPLMIEEGPAEDQPDSPLEEWPRPAAPHSAELRALISSPEWRPESLERSDIVKLTNLILKDGPSTWTMADHRLFAGIAAVLDPPPRRGGIATWTTADHRLFSDIGERQPRFPAPLPPEVI